MDSFVAGAIVAIVSASISGILAFVASNYRELQRRSDIKSTIETIESARRVLNANATAPSAPQNEKVRQAVTEIDEKSRSENYTACFDYAYRGELARLLGEKGGAAAIPFLARALKDTDNDVRIEAVKALSKIGGAKESGSWRSAFL